MIFIVYIFCMRNQTNVTYEELWERGNIDDIVPFFKKNSVSVVSAIKSEYILSIFLSVGFTSSQFKLVTYFNDIFYKILAGSVTCIGWWLLDLTSQTMTVLSWLPDTTTLESSLNLTQFTLLACSLHLLIGCPVATSQRITDLSDAPEVIWLEEGKPQ